MSLKTYSADELKAILAAHRKWLADEYGGVRADLRSANLRSADLRSADLRSANLWSADLGFADLGSADLRFADLRSADLGSADLRSADLRSAELGFADLRCANLRFADLWSADLWSADLGSANLGFADLGSADLRCANLRSANLRFAKWNDATQWPAITAVLLAKWGDVSDDLCRDLMRYDAACHPDPAAFDRWATGDGRCPYDDGLRVQRAAHFTENKALWSPGNVQPYDVFQRLLAEKLVKI